MYSKRQKRVALLVGVVLALLTTVAYWPVLHHGFLNYDDKDYVTENEPVLTGVSSQTVIWAFTATAAANWHPVTWISHMLDVQIFGLNAGAHHSVNLIFHAANTLLLFHLLRRLTGATWRSAVVAGLFALHPCHVESVAWVAERKDVLSTFFGLLVLLVYMQFTKATEQKKEPHSAGGSAKWPVSVKQWSLYLLALVLYALGLMSKPMLVTWPFVLLLLDFWPLCRAETSTGPGKMEDGHRKPPVWPSIVEKLPFFLLSIASSAVTFTVQHHAGAVSTLKRMPLNDRIGNALVAYVRYAAKLLWPENLAVYYPHPGTWPTQYVVGAAAIILSITVAVLCVRRQWPFLMVGWFWFLGTLVPVIGIVQVGGQSMADRYSYVPSIGLFIAVVWGCHAFLQYLPSPRLFVPLLALAILITFSVLTRAQLAFWRDSETLFTRALAVTPDNAIARFCLGNALLDRGAAQEGLEHLKRAAQLDPSFPNVHGKLGFLAAGRGQFLEAVQHYRRALECRPDFPEALNNLAWLLATCPDPSLRSGTEAVELASRACRLTDHQKTLYIGTLAAAYAEAGHFAEAVAAAQEAHAHALLWGEMDLAQRNEQLLKLYQEGHAFHEGDRLPAPSS